MKCRVLAKSSADRTVRINPVAVVLKPLRQVARGRRRGFRCMFRPTRIGLELIQRLVTCLSSRAN